jgi:hypothetical protein
MSTIIDVRTNRNIPTVNTYSDLPPAVSNVAEYYWVLNPQGTYWLPGSLGGTYYPKGLYFSNGTTWSHTETPVQASQIEVDAGVIDDKFVSPLTYKTNLDSRLYLTSLGDVVITTPNTNDVLIFNGADWVNGTISVASTLDDLTDVTITGVSSGQALVFNGTNWVNQNVATSSEGTLGIIFNGFGGTILANNQYPYLVVPFNCTINSWSLVGDVSGNLEIDIWRANNAIPTISDSIVATNYPNLTAQQINSDSTLTGWTVNLIAGDILNFKVNLANTITNATLTLKITK